MLQLTDLHGLSGAAGSLNDFPAGGAHFFGSTYLNRGVELTGNANSRVCTLSFWFKYATWGDREFFVEFPGGWNQCFIDTDDCIYCYGTDPSGTISCIGLRTSAIPRDQLWHHIVFAFDVTVAGAAMAFVDGVNVTTVTVARTNTDIGWTGRAGFIVGRRYDSSANWLSADLAEFYFNNKEFVDVRIPANMAKFRNAAGRPVNLGPDGSWVTGKPPIVYFSRSASDPLSAFQKNRGTGGNYDANGFAMAGQLWPEPTNPSSFWRNVFGSVNLGANTGWAGYTLRFNIPANKIFNVPPGQTQVRVTVCSDYNGNAAIFDKMYIGHRGVESWDAADLTQLTFFDGASGATVPGIANVGGFLTSDAVNWKYNGTSDIILTVHFTSAGGSMFGFNQGCQNYYATGDFAATLDVSGLSASSASYVIFFKDIEMI